MLGGIDLILVDKIVNEVKSQGVFDQFRKDSMADVDTKPAYQNLRQRVESSVGKFLTDQKWKSDLNKFQLREKLRKHIVDAGFLDTGVERIVDQVVNPKISAVFEPKIEDIAYNYLGIEKPHVSPKAILNGSLDIKTDLLPTDLEAVSPDSDKTKSETKEDINESFEDKNEEFESPPFEPLEAVPTCNPVKKEESDNSQLSGISGLTSQDSVTSEHKPPTPTQKFPISADTQAESDLSEVSSNSRLSIVTNDENSEASKPLLNKPADVDISEEAQMPKFSENSGETKVGHDLHFDIKREDIKFEGTERKIDPNMFSFAHQNETDIKIHSNDIKIEVKSEVDSDAHTYSDNICVKTEKDPIEISKIATIEEEKVECSAVDMSLSESESTRDSDSSSMFKNKRNSDIQSNESRSCIYRPRPPSPPNDYMLQKPPSPKYYMMPIPPPPPTPPLPPPPVDDSYDRPPPPPPPGTTSPPKPPSPVMPPLPPMPPSPTPPGDEIALPYIPLPTEVIHQRKPPSPPPLPPECHSLEGVQSLSSSNEGLLSIVSSHSSSVEFAFPIAPPPPPPPREELPTRQEETQAPEKDGDLLPAKDSKAPPPPPPLPPLPSSPDDNLRSLDSSFQSAQKLESDYSATSSKTSDACTTQSSPNHELQSSSSAYRPPSPKYMKQSPERSNTKDYQLSPKYRGSYSQFYRDQPSPDHDDYINSPSPPPYEELRANSPTSFDLKSISSKETSFSLSETSQNDSLSKPPSPFSPKKKTTTSKHETTHAPSPPHHKYKQDTKYQSDSTTLKPPSPPAQTKSASKSEHRSSKSSCQHSHHKSSKSSRDDKTVHHSHRSSSSSSRHHTQSSSHRSSDDRKHSSSSSSKHKSSKSDNRSKDREKDKNKKKDDHSSARHKEKRRKSTDSNDDDHHRHGSKHSSNSSSSRNTQDKPTQSGRTKEPPSNSNSSGNLSSSNSNSCKIATQRASTSTRIQSQKKLHRTSSKDEDLKYFLITEEERKEMSHRLDQLAETITGFVRPIYLLDCEETMHNEFREEFSNVINIEIEPSTMSSNKFEYKTIYLNCDSPPVNPVKHSLVKEAIMNNNTSNQKRMKNVSRKRKMESPSIRKSPKNLTLETENCLIIDCIEYDKPDKLSRIEGENRADVSPTSSDMSVSSKENEFVGGKVKKSSAKSVRNGKFIKAEGIVRIEKSSNNGFKLNSQRYSSEDLYKPRPLSQRPRRREQVSEAEL